jgi:hypothetical protein
MTTAAEAPTAPVRAGRTAGAAVAVATAFVERPGSGRAVTFALVAALTATRTSPRCSCSGRWPSPSSRCPASAGGPSPAPCSPRAGCCPSPSPPSRGTWSTARATRWRGSPASASRSWSRPAGVSSGRGCPPPAPSSSRSRSLPGRASGSGDATAHRSRRPHPPRRSREGTHALRYYLAQVGGDPGTLVPPDGSPAPDRDLWVVTRPASGVRPGDERVLAEVAYGFRAVETIDVRGLELTRYVPDR